MMKITNIKQQVKRTDRYSVFVDGKYSFSLSENELLNQRLASGMELDERQLKELKEASGNDKAYGNALRYVAMRPRSQWELEAYLKRKGVEEPVAEVIIERLQRVGLLDDLAFARAWVANRRLLKATSVRKLKLELKQKRLSESIIEQVMREDETDERDALRQLVAKKRGRYSDDIKLMQYLARQGFKYDDITSVMHEKDD
ncbi:MAG TPA: RecX family transcriptional regulator [Candidatus Saccharimonadales bacterium]|nr:RecX family transcriptional regulator [Candidatus Saccharimonadales bacterium]